MVEKSNLLIITGPQGSGNHLFSKLFNLHPDVYGWDMEKYWVGHHTEPFSEYWTDPSKLKYFNSMLSLIKFRDLGNELSMKPAAAGLEVGEGAFPKGKGKNQ